MYSPSLPKLPSHLTIPQKLTSSTDTAARDVSGRNWNPFLQPSLFHVPLFICSVFGLLFPF